MREASLHSMFRVVENVRLKHLDWVNGILSSKNWKQHRLAREAGLSPSALTKFIKDPTNTRTLNSYSIEKIEAATGMLLSGGARAVAPATRSDTADEVILVDAPPGFGDTLQVISNIVSCWEVRTNALELSGYIPGDILIVDATADPKPGDIVLVDIFDRQGNAEKIIRIFEQSFLRAATTDPRLMTPILLTKDVQVQGVMVHSVRNRRAA